jgi:hypothetical protein
MTQRILVALLSMCALSCSGGGERPQGHGDEGPDDTPPATVLDLAVNDSSATTLQLTWTAPGDDGMVGTASAYDLRRSNAPITLENWDQCTRVPAPAPREAGTRQTFRVQPLHMGTAYYFALRALDGVPNWSALSNVAAGRTLDPNSGWWSGFSMPPDGQGGDPSQGGLLTSLAVYQGELVVGGNFGAVGALHTRGIAAWNGSEWHALGSGMSYDGQVTDLCVSGGFLYVTGGFQSVGDIPAQGFARWDGSVWSTIPLQIGPEPPGQIATMFDLDGELVAAAYVGQSPPYRFQIARWDGSAWHAYGDPIRAGLAIAMYDGHLLCCGDGGVLAWSGSEWYLLGGGLGDDATVHDMCVYDGRLVVVGDFHLRDLLGHDIFDAAAWDGNAWGPFAFWGEGPGLEARTICLFQDRVAIGGRFEVRGDPMCYSIMTSDGQNRWGLGAGVAEPQDLVLNACEYNGDLYILGDFTRVGEKWSFYIARWTGGK